MLLRQVCQLAGPVIHNVLALRFDHDPQHRLGAAGTNEDTTGFPHAGFRGLDGLSEGLTTGPALATSPVRNRDIHKLLGISLKAAIHPAIEADSLAVAEGCELQRCEHPIATESMGRGKDVTGLFTAEGRTLSLIHI